MSFVYITEEGARIQKKGGKFLVGRNLEILFEIPEEVLEGLVLIGSVQVSSQAMVELLRLGIPVTWISGTGKFWFYNKCWGLVDIRIHKTPYFI